MSDPNQTSTPGGRPLRKAIRNVGRLFDAAGEAMWIVDSGHALIYINAQAAEWLGHDIADLVGKRCHAAIDRSDPLSDRLAAIAPPLGLSSGGEIVTELGWPPHASRCVRFTMHGTGGDAFVMAVTGCQTASPLEHDVAASMTLRNRLTAWRRQQATAGLVVTAGTSAHAARIRGQMQWATATRQSLAIAGPRGSGGESVARRLHLLSAGGSEAADPILLVEAALMDAELLEATLSPAAAHLGRQSGGKVTLLLRGLDESPWDVQERIVDFAAAVPDAVRLIGLLNPLRTPREDFSETGLSPPMALVMSVFEIALPSLADRMEDIPLMATALVEHRHALGNCVAQRLSRPALDRLLLYPWPDNLDELDAAMRHACTVCRNPAIGPDDLPLAIRTYRSHAVAQPEPIVATNLDDALRDFELEKIEQAIAWANGNRSEAARLLGISRARLLRRLDDSASDPSAT